MIAKGSAIYTFDPLDRLTEVISGTLTVEFSYDGDGVRLGKVFSGTATSYVQDIAAPLPVVLAESTGGQTQHYLYGNDLLALEDPAGVAAFYHQDGLGSIRALSNASGQRTDAYIYDVFGGLRKRTGNNGQQFRFAGEQTDAELRLIYLRARYYDSQLGRFIDRDTYPGIVINPRSLNRFTYSQNNPVNLIDPDGKFPHVAIGAAAGAIVKSSLYVVVDVGIKGEDFSGARFAGKAVSGAFSGGLAAATFGGSTIGQGAFLGASDYVIEHSVENLIKYHGDVSRIGEGITPSGVVGSAVVGGLSAGVLKGLLKGVESLPGYLKPTTNVPIGQLSLFDNTYGGTLRDVVGYEISKKLIGAGLKGTFGAIWDKFERDTSNGIVSTAYAPTMEQQYGFFNNWGGPPSGGSH